MRVRTAHVTVSEVYWEGELIASMETIYEAVPGTQVKAVEGGGNVPWQGYKAVLRYD